MNKYIHIGYPKTLTTTLQRCFFNNHSQIYHLGIGCGSNIDYRARDIHLMVEPYLVYSRDLKFSEKEKHFQSVLLQHFQEAREKKYRTVGLSCELLSITAPDHIDNTTKAKRLQKLFGSNTKIIIFIREQYALMRSLYLELVRHGYRHSFQKYIEYLYVFQDRSILYDLLYDKTYALYTSLFGDKNILMQPIESFLSPQKALNVTDGKVQLVSQLCEFLEIDYKVLTLERYNESLPADVALVKQQLNSQNVHDFGNDMFTPAFTHRLIPYFEDDIRFKMPDYAIKDVKTKRESIATAEKLKSIAQIDLSVPDMIRNSLDELISASNSNLKSMLGVDLMGYI